MVRSLVTLSIAVIVCSAASATEPGSLADAIEEHRRQAQESPSAGVLNDLANLLVLAGNHAEAESIYRRVLGLAPRDVEAEFNLGLLLQSSGQLDEAQALFTSVIETDPKNPWAHYQLGAIHEARELRQEAIVAYAQAFALDPELYFADVNPQVVANSLLTESLLEAARLRQSLQMAPMQYSRPREITEMLLSLPNGAADGSD